MSVLIHAAPACSVPDRAIVQKAILKIFSISRVRGGEFSLRDRSLLSKWLEL